MKQSRTCVLLAVLISTVAVSGQQVASGGSCPADILYAQPGKLVSVNGLGAALLDFLISVKFRASSLVRGRLRLSFFLDDFQSAATTGLG